MQTLWEGAYFDGLSAKRTPVSVTPTAQGLKIQRPEGELLWFYKDIRQTQGHYAGEPVRFEHGTDPTEALVIPDISCLTYIQRFSAAAAEHFHQPRLRRFRPYWILAAVCALLITVVGFYEWGIPMAAQKLAWQMPLAWEEKLGSTVVTSLAADLEDCENPKIQDAVSTLLKRLDAAAGTHPYDFRLRVVKHSQVNAFAAPGGYLVIYSGLLEKTRRPEELAGVLAHEVQHVLKRHATQSIFQQSALALLVAMVTGDVSGAAQGALQWAGTLGGLAYSRAYEAEADREGLALLVRAKIDPKGLADFFDTLSEENDSLPETLAYLSTHPDSRSRVRDLRQQAARHSNSGPYAPVLPGFEDWQTLMARCTT